MAEATRALGTKLMIGTNAVGNLSSIGGIEASAESIDVTALDSSGGYRRKIAGFKDGGEVSISGFFAPDDVGQAAIYAAFESGATSAYKIVFPPSLNAQWEFSGVVTGFSTSAELEDALTFEATITVSGEPILNLEVTP
ncbi:phage tail tube protein [Paenibacillus methanolicus]|uniref:Putative secreted protein n=1 Tax=Paenibacillus methanolicus TaxID=582686 RepID=A0A5S5BN60_9BACL|nr:phage tail tube protein [Paenibacillus methanolicus]TYP67696.1 putative secreted protein [Paenibacillus methanolicus]